MNAKNIFLIGYRCTGKTSVAKVVAEKLGWNFVDTDDLIAGKVGSTISEFVDRSGWDAFREEEREVVLAVAGKKHQVVATGGGVVLSPDNVKNLKACGWVILLQASPETIQKRMAGDRTTFENRPSLSGKGPLEEIEEELKKRETLYRKAADFTIQTDALKVQAVAQQILTQLPGKGIYPGVR